MIKLSRLYPRDYRRLSSDLPPGYQVYLSDTYQVPNWDSFIAAVDGLPQPEESHVTVRRELLTMPRGILSRPEIRGPALFRSVDSEVADCCLTLGQVRHHTACKDFSGDIMYQQSHLAHRAFLRLQVGEFVRLRFWVWYYTILRIK